MSFRRGSMLIDATVATALLAVLITFSLRAMTTMTAARRATDDRAIALQLAAGALEQAAALAWSDCTDENLAALAAKHSVDESLPGARLILSVHDDAAAEGIATRRLGAEVSWTIAASSARPVRLYHWVHRPAEEQR